MKKLLFTATLIGSLNAACVDVMIPQSLDSLTIFALQQDLGKNHGVLPFNDGFNWGCVEKASIEPILRRLQDPSIFEVLSNLSNLANLRQLSLMTSELLDESYSIAADKKKEHAKKIVRNLKTLWLQIP